MNNTEELISKFTSGFYNDYINKDPMFRAIFEMLLRDATPYEMIETLISERAKMNDLLVKLIQDNREFYRHLVDVVWGVAHEDKSVPSTDWADKMINRAVKDFIK